MDLQLHYFFRCACAQTGILFTGQAIIFQKPMLRRKSAIKSPESGVYKKGFSAQQQTDNDGIIHALNDNFVRDTNLKYMKMYDWMSRGYDVFEKIVGGFKYGREIREARKQLMGELEWFENAKVLYVSIGTGTDLKYLPANVNVGSMDIYGADISIGMLRKCKKNFHTLANKLVLVHACAEDLPFADNAFDIVFHVGGINFFSDKTAAIQEMLRVARPGSKLMVADETTEHIDKEYKKSLVAGKYFQDAQFNLENLKKEISLRAEKCETKLLWDGKFYRITFRKKKTRAVKPSPKPKKRSQ